ncbi:hypothetical protein KPH14_012632 [Odynerus spinipes]|uniref:Uncharacterized protein n=1 Tax=Odynerus spinipes TaxID=1348599 RepID=A0AAD9RFZ5_9HYME|nr:hypothetical protein KPH14_012632 [Odynerus spinipes]
MLEIDKLVFNFKQLENKQQPTIYDAQMTEVCHQLCYYGATAIRPMRSLDQSTYHSQSSSYTAHTPFNPQQSPIAQSLQSSPSFQNPSPSPPSTSSHSPGYQSPYHSQPSPHTHHSIHSEPPRSQTNPINQQQSPSVRVYYMCA